MARLLFLFIALAFVLSVAVTTYAQSDNRGRGQGQGQNQGQGSNNGNRDNSTGVNDVVVSNTEVAPTSSPSNRGQGNQKARVASPSAQPSCDPSLEWKNHGEYVKCVAKLKQGGQAVSEAARSDVGKRNTGTSSASPSAVVSPTPNATASASPDASSSATPSASISPSPEATESGIISSTVNNVVGGVKGFFKKLRGFFGF